MIRVFFGWMLFYLFRVIPLLDGLLFLALSGVVGVWSGFRVEGVCSLFLCVVCFGLCLDEVGEEGCLGRGLSVSVLVVDDLEGCSGVVVDVSLGEVGVESVGADDEGVDGRDLSASMGGLPGCHPYQGFDVRSSPICLEHLISVY